MSAAGTSFNSVFNCTNNECVVYIEISKDDIEATAVVSSYTSRGSVQVSKAAAPVFCYVPYGAAPSGYFSLNSPPPTPNLCIWLCLLAILTASAGFTLSLCAAPPTNLPLSLLWESLVIAIGLDQAVPHLCEHGILYVSDTHTGFSQILSYHNKIKRGLATDRNRVLYGLGTGRRGSPHLCLCFYYTSCFW